MPTGKLPLGASRVFYRAIDGTIPYFINEGGIHQDGRLPEGSDPKELLQQGFVEADREAFVEARARLDPLRRPPERSREVNVNIPGGKVRMDPADADAYAAGVDASWERMTGGQPPEGDNMQNMLDPQAMAFLEEHLASGGTLEDLFQAFQQEQNVLDQQMALGQQMRQRMPERSTPTGALLSGLANAAGNVGGTYMQTKALDGQKALGGRMSKDASGRIGALMRMVQKMRGGAAAPAETESFELPKTIQEMGL